MSKYFNENIFEKHLLEKWLGFYTFQLKRDLNDEAQYLINTLELAQDQERIVQSDISIIDINIYNKKNKNSEAVGSFAATNSLQNKELKSKLLFDSIKTLFLLINKISRLKKKTASSLGKYILIFLFNK